MVAMTVKFPAMRGKMGLREYYVAMVPLSAVPKLFTFDDWASLSPEQRAQRKLSTKRVPEITRYILEHEEDWVFSSLTASFNADETFEPSGIDGDLGILELPLTGEFLINDGQHRRAAIVEALKENKTLENQTISVVFFREEDIERNQQMFSDLNRTVQKTSRSLDILYDHRDPMNEITMDVVGAVPLFKGKVEKEAVSLAARSAKFITSRLSTTPMCSSLASSRRARSTRTRRSALRIWRPASGTSSRRTSPSGSRSVTAALSRRRLAPTSCTATPSGSGL